MNTTQNTRSIQWSRIGTTIVTMGFGAAAVFAVNGSAVAESPAYDGPGYNDPGHHGSKAPAGASQYTFTSPCFAVRTPDRWPAEAGPQPRCEHTYVVAGR